MNFRFRLADCNDITEIMKLMNQFIIMKQEE